MIIYGSLYVALGLFFGSGFQTVVQVFPLPVLGVLLLFESLTLLALMRDLSGDRASFLLAALVGVVASSVPFGYLAGLLLGLACHHLMRRGLVRLGA